MTKGEWLFLMPSREENMWAINKSDTERISDEDLSEALRLATETGRVVVVFPRGVNPVEVRIETSVS